MKSENVNNNWIGTCRGIAVIGVLLTHFLPQIDNAFQLESKIIRGLTVDYIDTGKMGVALLFLIAGYLTSASKMKRNVNQFVINRFFRLYPLYWVSIILVGIFFTFDGYGLDTILANVTMLQIFFRKEDLIGVFWTLPIELIFYVGGVLFEKYMWNKKGIFCLYVIASIGTMVLGVVRHYVWSAAPVAMGLLLTIGLLGQQVKLYNEKIINRKYLLSSVLLFELIMTITSILAYQQDMGHQENWHRYVLSYTLAIMIFTFFLHTKKTITFFSTIAIVAYPLYLFQEIVFRIAFEKIWHDGIKPFLFVIVTLGALVIMSVAAHIFVEKPMISLSRKMEFGVKGRT